MSTQEPPSTKHLIMRAAFPVGLAILLSIALFIILYWYSEKTSANLYNNSNLTLIVFIGLVICFFFLESVWDKNKDLIVFSIECLAGFAGLLIGCFVGTLISFRIFSFDIRSYGYRFLAGFIAWTCAGVSIWVSVKLIRTLLKRFYRQGLTN